MIKNKIIIIFGLVILLFVSLIFAENQEANSNNIFKFDQKKWNEIRYRVENDIPLYEEKTSSVTVETPKVVSPTTIEFVEGTQLTIAGRKLIGMEIKNTQYPYKPEYNRTDVNMRQELQVSVRGKVGKNVDVNIDIDDTQPDKRDISIIYRGEGVDVGPGAVGYKAKPGAFIQEAAFGDIQLSLPNTEFVGYSRQVFGLKVIGQYNKLKMHLIASQSKGNFETRRFTGKTEFERKIIYDTSYVRRKYYKVSFGNYKIKKDSIKIYLDTMDPQRDPATLVELTARAFSISTFTYTGKFELLAAGRDYIIDYSTGIITFTFTNRSIQPNWVIAIDYVDENTGLNLSTILGTTYYILIKDKDETPGITTELLNRYSIGRTNIIRDNGTGNFLLKIIDKSDRVLDPSVDKIYPDNKPVPVYQTGNIGSIKVNFEDGEIYFDSDKPFAEDCYDKTPQSRYNILVEYRYRSKTYFLKPFIVPYSERINVDGKLLQRNIDYWIDYDSGFITFLKEEEISENSIVEVSYEYSMLGLQGGETIVGGRLELPLSSKFFIGSSWIGNLPTKGTSVPDIRNTPSSLNVWEVDSKLINLKAPLIPFQINSISGEYAENEKTPNIWDKAIVENMEGITLEDSVSTYRHMWFYGSCSDVYIPGQYDDKTDKIVGGELNWENEDVLSKEINPNRETTLEKQQVLRINYDLYSSSEVAMTYVFSKYGLDFTKKIYIELEFYSSGGGGELYLDLGNLSEDIDNDGILDTEDKNQNGMLDIDEDIGLSYNKGANVYYIGKNNGRSDTEDLDRDGILNGLDKIAGGYKVTDLNFTGWRSTIIPVAVTDKVLWSSVKHARLRIKGFGKSGVVKIAKISVVGNKFEISTPHTTRIYAVNNENDLTYKKLSELEDYSSIYGMQYSASKVEQALAINYKFDSMFSSSVVSILYSRAQDFTYHHKLNFFLYKKTPDNIIFKLRAYTDQNNYFEYSTYTVINIDDWLKFTIEQNDINNDNVPDEWVIPSNSLIGGVCSKIGSPNLQALSKLEIIIESPDNSLHNGLIYVNDIYLSGSWKRKGIAKKFEVSMSVPGWLNFGGSIRSVDRKFETFTTAISNRDNTITNGYFSLTKFDFLRLDFQGKQETTLTPSAIKAGNLVSKIEEGKRVYTEGSFNTGLRFNKLPQLGFNYTKSVSSATSLSRTDMKDSFRTTFSYPNPLYKYIPIRQISLTYTEEKLLLYPWEVVTSTASPALDNSRYITLGIPLDFWDKLSLNFNFSTKSIFSEIRKFNKNIGENLIVQDLYSNKDIMDYYTKLTFFTLYNLNRTYEMYYTTYSVVISSYEKRNECSTSFDSSINLISFFKPSLSYKIEMFEDYNFPISDKKDITRNASGNISVNFMPKDILNLKQIQTLKLYYSYNLTAGDKYEKLPKYTEFVDLYNFKNLNLLWYKTELSTTTELRRYVFERKENKLSSSWKLFEGIPLFKPLIFLKNTDLSLSYSDSLEEKENMQTKTLVYTKVWPDITATLYNIEKVTEFFLDRQNVVNNTKLDLTYTYRTTKTEKISFEQSLRHRESLSLNLFKDYQILCSYERTNTITYSYMLSLRTNFSYVETIGLQVGFPFFGQRLTPRYEYKKDYAEDARRLSTRDITTHSFSVSYYADILPKQGLNLFGKTLPMQNRVRINSSLSYTRTDSPIDISRNNTDNFNFTAKADYDVSKYINVTVGFGSGFSINRVVKADTNYNFSINGQVIIRF